MAIILGALLIASTPLTGLYAMVGIIKSPHKWRRYLPFYILTVFMVSHAFLPDHEMDLTRYFELAERLIRYDNFFLVLNHGEEGLFVRNIFLWAMAKLGDVRLIPAVSNSIVYGIAFYIAADTAEREEAWRLIPAIVTLQIIALPFYNITSNVRNVCAFSLIILASYFDFVKNRRTIGNLILYVLPCFLHSAGFIILLLRILVSFTGKHRFVLLSAFLFMPTAIRLAYDYRHSLNFLGGTIQYGIVKLYSYWNTENISAFEIRVLNSTSQQLQRLLMMVSAVLLLLLFYWYMKHNGMQKVERFQTLFMFICAMTLACWVFIAPHYWRFYCAAIIASPVVLIPVMKNRKVLPWHNRLEMYGLSATVLAIFIHSSYRTLLGIQIKGFIEEVLINNIYRIFFNCIINNKF